MEDPETPPLASSSLSSNEDRPLTSSTSSFCAPSTSLPVQEEEQEAEEGLPAREENAAAPELIRQRTSVSYRIDHAPLPLRPLPAEEPAGLIRDDTWHCIIVILTFWFFVSLTLILGIYGSEDIQLGPYSSILLQPNPIFVQYLKIEKLEEVKVDPVLYGFYEFPSLDVNKTWSEALNVSIISNIHKEWVYYLDRGSQINISYRIESSSSLLLIIAQGYEGMAQWLEDCSYPNTTLSWNIVYGSGTISQDISKSSDYYVAVANFNSEDVKVQLNFQIRSSIYDTTGAYYKCDLTQSECRLKMLFPRGNAAVLTSPGPQEGYQSEKLYVKLSYEPRWITYFLGIGGMTMLMLFGFNFLNKSGCNNEDGTGVQAGELGPERTPLLSRKDDDVSSLGSSYDSASLNDEDVEESLEEGLTEGKPPRQLCVTCFDAPRDCFFLPCGHCATCFTCGTRIAESAGTCPICRRKMKKVKKIFTV